MPDRAPAQRDPEAHHAPLAASRLCHAPARDRHRRAQDPAADGASRPLDDGTLLPAESFYVLCRIEPAIAKVSGGRNST
uniref:Uncharacterized protein n=1 Tax=Cupriavidus taiwanensis TaxID=164546 RepID=A0A375HCQ7_9BURK|nr:protein of unknown function [Cupriavidus taiwanensis]